MRSSTAFYFPTDNLILIGKSQFAVQGVLVPLVAHAFGDPKAKPDVIWSVAAGPLVSSDSVREAVEEHLREHFPEFSISFLVRAKIKLGYRTGEWAIRFESDSVAFFNGLHAPEEPRFHIMLGDFNRCQDFHGRNSSRCEDLRVHEALKAGTQNGRLLDGWRLTYPDTLVHERTSVATRQMKEALSGILLDELSRIAELLQDPYERGYRSPIPENASQVIAKFDYLLERIRTKAKQIQEDFSKQRNKLQRRLEGKIKKLDSQARTPGKAQKLRVLKGRLEALLEVKAKRQILLSKASLLQRNASPNTVDYKGNTPLFHAIHARNTVLVKVLLQLQHNASPNTPLFHLEQLQRAEMGKKVDSTQ
ncbi:hypothetical protein FPQ18DRAFT_409936 [Pyronema domesticum]|nr:hypothetical protein FPQ18DRAFT_409936 [Pyronema domesticum]